MTATQSGRSTVPGVLIRCRWVYVLTRNPPRPQPTRTGRTLLAGFGWFCRLLPRTGSVDITERGGRVEERRLTASRFSAWQQERLEGKTEKQPHRTVGRLGFGYKDCTVQRIQQEPREIHRRDVGRDFTSFLSLLDDDAQAARRAVEMLRHAFLQSGRRVCDLRRKISDKTSAKVVESLQLLQDGLKILTQPP